jgi:hypothetical protein
VHLGHVADPRLHVFAEPGARIWKKKMLTHCGCV